MEEVHYPNSILKSIPIKNTRLLYIRKERSFFYLAKQQLLDCNEKLI